MVDEFGDFGWFEDMDLCQIEQEAVAAIAATQVPAPAPTTSTIANSAQASMDGGQAQFSMRVQERQNSPQKKKAKTSLLGAERWGIRKAHIADASIHKIYILQLSSYHRICLGTVYSYAIQQLGLSATRAAVVDKMVSIFNSWHTVALQNGDPRRFGGYISRHLVE